MFTLNINPPDKSPSSPYRRCRATLVSRSRVSSTPPFIDDRSTWSAAKCRHQLSYHPAGWRVLVLADPGLLRRDSHPLGTLRSCCYSGHVVKFILRQRQALATRLMSPRGAPAGFARARRAAVSRRRILRTRGTSRARRAASPCARSWAGRRTTVSRRTLRRVRARAVRDARSNPPVFLSGRGVRAARAGRHRRAPAGGRADSRRVSRAPSAASARARFATLGAFQRRTRRGRAA